MALKIFGGLFSVFGLVIIVGNYGALATNFINRKRHVDRFVSGVFLFGGLSLCVGLFLLLPKFKLLALLSLLIDPSVPMFIYYLICLFMGKIEK